MTYLKKTVAVSTLAALALSATPALAAPKSLTVEGTIQQDFSYNSADEEVSSNNNQASIKATLAVREGLKAVIKINFDDLMNGQDFDMDSFEEAIEEAYIEVDANGRATILFGKHQMAYAQQIARMAIPENDQRFALANEREMIGLTVQLPKDTLGIVGQAIDQLEVSIFETGSGDFEVSDDAGVSMRATKALSDKMTATVSALMKQQAGDDEYRAAVSVAYAADNGWTFYAEGQWMQDNPTYPDAAYAVTAGAEKEVGPGTLVLQASYVENNGSELGASYHLPVSQSVTFSPEIRINDEGDTSVAARVTIQGSVSKDLSGDLPEDDQL